MTIMPSTALRNQYNEISAYCKKTGEPVFLTKNGEGDLVVMSLEAYEQREAELKIKEKLMEIKMNRMNGGKGYSIDDLKAAVEDILNDEEVPSTYRAGSLLPNN